MQRLGPLGHLDSMVGCLECNTQFAKTPQACGKSLLRHPCPDPFTLDTFQFKLTFATTLLMLDLVISLYIYMR